jgi:hypothetical protein
MPELDAEDPIGVPLSQHGAHLNYQLGGKDNGIMFMCVLHCLWSKEDPWGSSGSSGTPCRRAATSP